MNAQFCAFLACLAKYNNAVLIFIYYDHVAAVGADNF